MDQPEIVHSEHLTEKQKQAVASVSSRPEFMGWVRTRYTFCRVADTGILILMWHHRAGYWWMTQFDFMGKNVYDYGSPDWNQP